MGERGRESRGVRRYGSNQQALRNAPNLDRRKSDRFQDCKDFLSVCTPLLNVTNLFLWQPVKC